MIIVNVTASNSAEEGKQFQSLKNSTMANKRVARRMHRFDKINFLILVVDVIMYTADDQNIHSVAEAEIANPLEVRRIFTVGLPDRVVRGGQILFGPADGLLYVMTGIGTHRGDPYNFAQNKGSLLGKILRIDVDKGNEVHNQGLWGNYSIPRDNPYNNDKPISA